MVLTAPEIGLRNNRALISRKGEIEVRELPAGRTVTLQFKENETYSVAAAGKEWIYVHRFDSTSGAIYHRIYDWSGKLRLEAIGDTWGMSNDATGQIVITKDDKHLLYAVDLPPGQHLEIPKDAAYTTCGRIATHLSDLNVYDGRTGQLLWKTDMTLLYSGVRDGKSGLTVAKTADDTLAVVDLMKCRVVWKGLPKTGGNYWFSNHSNSLVMFKESEKVKLVRQDFVVFKENSEVKLLRQNRPDTWYGLACLWQFWLTVVFAAGLAWSFHRDRRVGQF